MAKRPNLKFAENLRFLLKRHHMTQAALGRELGVTESIIGYYVRGVHDPSFDLGAKISYFFGVEAYEMAFENLEEILPPVVEREEPKSEKVKNVGGIVSVWVKKTKGRNPKREKVENIKEAFNELVGGQASLMKLASDVGILYNEESFEDFTCIIGGAYFYGPVVFVGLAEDGTFTDCAMNSELFKDILPDLWKH